MFGMGFSELVMIFVVALIVFGPKRLPELAKKLGSFLGSIRSAADNVKSEISFHVNMDEEKRAIDEKYKKLHEEAEKTENANENIN